ncbi:hypothetical protein T492DRAFT_872333 [Pavlovales sp. CCMP2436]|nr:hypothetical protein T492DRAFT_872333 [Pavlovales sp. CCMP2436]
MPSASAGELSPYMPSASADKRAVRAESRSAIRAVHAERLGRREMLYVLSGTGRETMLIGVSNMSSSGAHPRAGREASSRFGYNKIDLNNSFKIDSLTESEKIPLSPIGARPHGDGRVLAALSQDPIQPFQPSCLAVAHPSS